MNTLVCAYCGENYGRTAAVCPACGMSPATPELALPAGTKLQGGKFALGRVLGEGGFGITYKGAHTYLRRPVAIKELCPQGVAVRVGRRLAVPASRQAEFRRDIDRILAEARRIAGFNSPSIVYVHDMFQENGTAYVVMEYLEGQTLAEKVERMGPLPAAEVRQLAFDLCNALDTVHAHSLLHRDIKPANIVLTRDGRSVLIDFGSAREFRNHQSVRHTRMVTEGYAAPEQYSSKARFGPATDIFGLGATLFHALTGAPPPDALERLQNSRQTLELPSGLPAELHTCIVSCLQLQVPDRPQTIAALRRLLEGEDVPDDPYARENPQTSSPQSSGPDDPDRPVSARPSAHRGRSSRQLLATTESDREVLRDLFHATNGAHWKNRRHWLSHEPLGAWYGVTTDHRGCVLELSLPRNQLSGTLPPELGNLTQLRTLRLPGNQLRGIIPPELGNLASLTWLDLARNQLRGTIPRELGRLRRLLHLNLARNRLRGAIPPELDSLTRLVSLYLAPNVLEGSISASLRGVRDNDLTDLNLPFR